MKDAQNSEPKVTAEKRKNAAGTLDKLISAIETPIFRLFGANGKVDARSETQKKFEPGLAELSKNALLKKFKTSTKGLSGREAKRRLGEYGFNEPARTKEVPLPLQILERFKNPLIIVLLIVATVSLLTNQLVSAVLVYFMTIISVSLSFYQEYKAKREAQKLIEMVSVNATAVREGRHHELNTRQLVPGDIVLLSAGNIIPADLRIIDAKDLFINQATLTGESFPVEKTGESIIVKGSSITELTNIAFMGSNVMSGTGVGLVVKTGPSTQFGELATMISGRDTVTSFDIGVNSFVRLMIWFIVILTVPVFVLNTLLKGDAMGALLFALAVTVGITPEMLPMLITVNLSSGAMKMSKKKVIVKRLSAIQNLGAMDVLCSDKTGTITLGEVVLERHFDLQGRESEEVLEYAYMNSYFQTGLKNLLDKAIIKHEEILVRKRKKVDEIPFDFTRRLMSVVMEDDGGHILITKGAPEEVLRRCNRYELDGDVYEIGGKISEHLMGESDKYARQGFRVLALAYRKFKHRKKSYSKDDESELVLKGFIIFLDPPKPDAKKILDSLRKLGIQLKILTGDNELVSKKICGDVGIDVSSIVTGDKIDNLSDEELLAVVNKTSVFARLNPIQKERVIRILKKAGHTVGFLGDGINDAPSIKTADVGISVDNAADIAKETADIILLEKSLLVLEDGVMEGRKVYGNVLKYIKMGASSNVGNMISVSVGSVFLPFLPMTSLQILVNNFLYDMSQLTIPTDNLDAEYLLKPTPWRIDYIKNFIIAFGPISSLYDLMTYAIGLYFYYYLNGSIALFQTFWFLESLGTQTFVIYIIRTSKVPFLQSSPSKWLALTTAGIVLTALLLTLSPVASMLGFAHPPVQYLLLIVIIIAVYLVHVQVLKGWFIRKYGWQ
ncbi:magnesium-translocating P-type ATPase [Candidatus Micrarchaeota archaeon]|nr:magnesium-translocating P-type ATPase [Candidatus Micrarchaeota archaeon]